MKISKTFFKCEEEEKSFLKKCWLYTKIVALIDCVLKYKIIALFATSMG